MAMAMAWARCGLPYMLACGALLLMLPAAMLLIPSVAALLAPPHATGPTYGHASSVCTLAPPGVSLGSGSIAMVVVRNGSAACCNACTLQSGCVAFSYEAFDHHCYLKSNKVVERCQHRGCISGTVHAGPPPPRPQPPPPASSLAGSVSINVSKGVIARFSPHFLGVNADWWLDGCGGEGSNWSDNASIALVDLSNSRLRSLARGLSGGTFRVGGTHGDSVIYGGSTAATACPAVRRRCYPICLTPARWEAIVDFANASGLKLAFGLNMACALHSTILIRAHFAGWG
jgi:hypothetical protein